jgi:hypothetical protein
MIMVTGNMILNQIMKMIMMVMMVTVDLTFAKSVGLDVAAVVEVKAGVEEGVVVVNSGKSRRENAYSGQRGRASMVMIVIIFMMEKGGLYQVLEEGRMCSA